MSDPAKSREDPIPGKLNLALAALSTGASLGLLRLASHAPSWPWILLAAAAFSYVANTVFSILHEAVHGIAHPDSRLNAALGMLTAAMFPTSFGFQRICHLGHHRRNRTDAELFDYYLPRDNRFLKAVQWYGILTGFYWLLAPLACLLYLLDPGLPGRPSARSSSAARQTGAAAMLSGFEDAPRTRIRLEILGTLAFQVGCAHLLDLSWIGWGACYAAFAVNWSSLQYADHAWSVRDVRAGAWNLRVNPVVRLLFLNYHHHKAHHLHPAVPWVHLPRYVDRREQRPSFLRTYLSMWHGPRLLPREEA